MWAWQDPGPVFGFEWDHGWHRIVKSSGFFDRIEVASLRLQWLTVRFSGILICDNIFLLCQTHRTTKDQVGPWMGLGSKQNDTWKTNCTLQHLPKSPKERAASPTLQDTTAGPAVDTAFVYRTPAPATVKLATAAKTKAAPAQQAASNIACCRFAAASICGIGSGFPPPGTPSDIGDDGLPPSWSRRRHTASASSQKTGQGEGQGEKQGYPPGSCSSTNTKGISQDRGGAKGQSQGEGQGDQHPAWGDVGAQQVRTFGKRLRTVPQKAGMTFDPESESWN